MSGIALVRATHSNGVDRARTGNLRVANAALSQLSYDPESAGQHTASHTFQSLSHRRPS